jgi:RimJ/RimL family protein N-acetyltransferase
MPVTHEPRQPGPLPDRLHGRDGVLVRRWRVADAEILAAAVAQSIDHVRPWMDWVSQEPMTLAQRRLWLAAREREWAIGGDVVMGIFIGDQVVGGCGLHHRVAAGGLEIGYWVHPSFLRRGIATEASRVLTESVLARPEFSHTEIHHDKANVASGGVPRKLGYRLMGERRDSVDAPAEVGIECIWRMDAEVWATLRSP